MIAAEITQPNSDFSLNYKLIVLKVHDVLLSDTATSREFAHTNPISARKIAKKENRVSLTVKSAMNTRYGCGGRTRFCLCDKDLQKPILRIYPFAVPDRIFELTLFLDFIDRSTCCVCAASAAGSAQARDPTSYARRSYNPESISL